MPYLYRAPGPQKHPVPKDARVTHSSGQSFEQLRQECAQKGVLFEDPDFPANNSSLFYSERPQIPFVWKRPGEIVKNPEFILGGATRTDICQGELGVGGRGGRGCSVCVCVCVCLKEDETIHFFQMADTFWTNPQIKLSLTEKDEGQKDCTFLVALMQKDRRKLKRFGADMLTIGYAIYQSPGKGEHLNKDFFRYHASQARSKTFINLREVSDRFKLPPGEYILIPSTFEPHQEADFCLRIFSEKKAITQDMDGDVDIDLPEPPKPTPAGQETEEELQFRALFEHVAGEDMEVTAEELEYVLNAVLSKKKDLQFKKLSLISCKNIISLMDTSGNGKLEFEEFKAFWDKLKTWTNLFLQFDADKSGTMSSYELRTALKAAGFQLSHHLLQLVVLRYADEGLQLGFDDFLNCLVRLENASREWLVGMRPLGPRGWGRPCVLRSFPGAGDRQTGTNPGMTGSVV
ncbi:calpain-9 [Ailuropoda melanoleuca]|uniref:calpain-9 n=1 Tax=Ailuropoda melanoleuca TaxID=9646 RepID=UPI0014943A8C|nr:calpain-9 [Ailuropoda melanoleuca]